MLEEALKELFETFRVIEPRTLKIYLKKLQGSGLDEEIICERINKLCLIFKPEFGKKIPSISEIIGIDLLAKDVAEAETAWQYFKKNYCNNYKFEPIEDWVFTIKNLIGASDVEEMNNETEKWIKKEFLRIFPSVKNGLIKLQKENKKYLKHGNVVLNIQDKSEDITMLLRTKQKQLLIGKEVELF